MRCFVPAMLVFALVLPVACPGQVQPPEITPPEPPPPPAMDTPEPPAIPQAETGPDTAVDIGLISSAQRHLANVGLMVVSRELTPEEQEQMQRGHAVGELLGLGGRNFIGNLASAAAQRGTIQEAIRDLEAGETQAAIDGLKAAIAELPDAKILHRLIASAYSRAGNPDSAFDHRIATLGSIPAEDLIFVDLVRTVSAVDEADEYEKITIPPEQQAASVVTVARMVLGAMLFNHMQQAGELLDRAGTIDTSNTPAGDLAAAAMAELAYTALPLLEEVEDFTGRNEMPESIIFAGVAATDGRWGEHAFPRISEAASLAPEGDAGDVVRAMDALVGSVLGIGEGRMAEIAQVAEKHDLTITRKYLEHRQTQ